MDLQSRRLETPAPGQRGGTGPGSSLPFSILPPLEALGPRPGHVSKGDMTHEHPSVHGALAVAEKSLEVCVQPVGGPWDFAALAVIVEEAGGRFSDLEGSPDVHADGVRIYSNDVVHDAVRERLHIVGATR